MRIGGQPHNHIAALDSATGATHRLESGWNMGIYGGVGCLVVSGGTVCVGGISPALAGNNASTSPPSIWQAALTWDQPRLATSTTWR